MDDICLNSLRDSWRIAIENDGSHCPVCDRWGKIYGRSINETMAKSLVWLCQAQANNLGWVDVPSTAPRWLVRSNQLPTLKWWNLVERENRSEDSNTKYSGMWRPTNLGQDFVYNGIRVPKKVFTYNNVVEGHSSDTVLLSECFKDYFNYTEVMNSRFLER
jgi:hypothetical protein